MTVPDHLLDDLHRRLETIEAKEQIRTLLRDYCVAIDTGDYIRWAEVFAPDGVWEVGGPGARLHMRVAGQVALRAFAQRHTHSPEAWHQHVTTEALIVVDGDRARSTCSCFRLDGLDDGPTLQSFGRYLDLLVRGPDGRWQIAHRRLVVEASRPSPFGFRAD